MLTLKLSPSVQNRKPLVLDWQDPILKVNGIDYNLSLLGDGKAVSHPVLLEASRSGSNYGVTIMFPISESAGESSRFPKDIEVDSNGKIKLPAYTKGVSK